MSDRELNSRVLPRTRLGLYHVHPGSPGNSMSGLWGIGSDQRPRRAWLHGACTLPN